MYVLFSPTSLTTPVCGVPSCARCCPEPPHLPDCSISQDTEIQRWLLAEDHTVCFQGALPQEPGPLVLSCAVMPCILGFLCEPQCLVLCLDSSDASGGGDSDGCAIFCRVSIASGASWFTSSQPWSSYHLILPAGFQHTRLPEASLAVRLPNFHLQCFCFFVFFLLWCLEAPSPCARLHLCAQTHECMGVRHHPGGMPSCDLTRSPSFRASPVQSGCFCAIFICLSLSHQGQRLLRR